MADPAPVPERNVKAGPGTDLEAHEGELYARHKKVYPREVHGIFATLRWAAVLVLLGLYYFLPWITWNGRQSVLFDLPDRKFYIFGWTFWPQDFFYLALLLIIAALSLFFFTALAGRLWCGYACPQTVWTEVFQWIERKIEGDRSAQMKLARSPWTARKIRLRVTKQVAWLLFAFWTGFTFVGFFTPIRELWHEMLAFNLGPWETFWVIFYGLATYGNAGYLREQVCIYMCPYARFQSAMFDKDTLIISYDEKRGEPRGKRKKGVDPKEVGLGDCVDCTLCVQVCPTGIDIRNGLQYQCIGCAACIDACDQVMEKVGYPKGLIRYTTQNAMEGKPTHILRPRMVVYALLLLAAFAALMYAIATRVPMELDVIRDRNALYRNAPGGLVENVYNLRLINMSDHPRTFRIELRGLPEMELINRYGEIEVAPGELASIDVQVRVDPVVLKRPVTEIEFVMTPLDGEDEPLAQPTRFIGPVIR
ncbi:MAG TPA: cytochrome c oxidase accessory protein CcoG [Thiotrichales bacterium]|nr:cytochrome c oxidase accessory protein CcoG [Thiotrichales bacterium]